MISLPRQARDKHRESTQKQTGFLQLKRSEELKALLESGKLKEVSQCMAANNRSFLFKKGIFSRAVCTTKTNSRQILHETSHDCIMGLRLPGLALARKGGQGAAQGGTYLDTKRNAANDILLQFSLQSSSEKQTAPARRTRHL
jgi:hypothetical protein